MASSAPSTACLDDDVLLAFLEGGLSVSQRAQLNRHIAGCGDCRRLLAEAARVYFEHEPEGEPVTVAEGLRGARKEASPVASPFEHAARVGRYLVLGPIGAGGMGVVYAAHDPQLDRQVALKLMRPDLADTRSQEGKERLLREAQAMARVSHPNVVTVHDAGTFEGQVFMAMELVKGTTLSQWLREKPRTWEAALAVMVSAGRGLAAAHAAGLVHRDFKPQNVLLGVDGRVLVTDFGLARVAASGPADEPALPAPVLTSGLSASVTRTGTILGTPAYMAPEQYRGEAPDPRTDQFSFCIATYEALYGERPFDAPEEGPGPGKLRPVPPGAQVPSWLHQVLLRGLSLSAAARYPSMEALLSALQPTAAPEATTTPALAPPARSPRMAWGLGAAAAVTVLGALGFWAVTRESPASAASTPPSAVPAVAIETPAPAPLEPPAAAPPVPTPAPDSAATATAPETKPPAAPTAVKKVTVKRATNKVVRRPPAAPAPDVTADDSLKPFRGGR